MKRDEDTDYKKGEEINKGGACETDEEGREKTIRRGRSRRSKRMTRSKK